MRGNRKEEARRWYQQAVHDLHAAAWNLEGGFANTACFLSQQGAEKALKSLLYYLGARRQALLTHSLVEMIREVAEKLAPMLELLDDARSLDLHYIPSRYPNGLPSGFPHTFYSETIARTAIAAGNRILSAVKDFYAAEQAAEILDDGK